MPLDNKKTCLGTCISLGGFSDVKRVLGEYFSKKYLLPPGHRLGVRGPNMYKCERISMNFLKAFSGG